MVSISTFERLCRASGAAPFDKIVAKDGTLYLAEGFSQGMSNAKEPERRGSHFTMVWAAERPGKMSVGHKRYLSAVEFPLRTDRVAETMKAVSIWLDLDG